MDESERKEEASLPPNYVSLAQLQEIWLKKQQEKKLKKIQEDEKKNDGHEKVGVVFVRNVQGTRLGKDGREMGVIAEKEKGEEVVVEGFENGEENQRKYRNHRRTNRHKMKSEGDEGKGKEVEKEKVEIKEFDGGDGCEGVESVGGELKGVKEVANVCMVEVLPRNGVKREIDELKRKDFRGGFRKNGDNRGLVYERKKEYGGRVNESKQGEGGLALRKRMEDGKGYGKKWGERGRNGEHRERYYRLKENGPNVLKGKEVELESEKEAEDEIVHVFNEKCGLNGRDRSGVWGQCNNGKNKTNEDKVEGEGFSDDAVALEKKVDHEVLVADSAKNGKKGGVGSGNRRYGNWRGNIDEQRRYTSSGKFDNCRNMKQREHSGRFGDRWNMTLRESGKIWVKKEEKGADAAEVGYTGVLGDWT